MESGLPPQPPPMPSGPRPPPPPPGYERPRFFYLNLGEILGRCFTIWFKNLIPFFFMSLLIKIPLLITGALYHDQGPWNQESQFVFDGFIFLTDNFVLQPLLAAAVTFAVIEHLRGRRVSIGRCFSAGLSRIFPVLGVALLYFLAVVGGMILLIVPGIILSIMYYVAMPVAVVERPGVIASLKRSAALTKGYRGTIFGITLLFGLIVGGAMFVLMVPALLASGAVTPAGKIDGPLGFFLPQGLALFFTSLSATLPGVLYHALRNGKEGADVEELAKVFE